MHRNLTKCKSIRLNKQLQEQIRYCSEALGLNESDIVRQGIRILYKQLKK